MALETRTAERPMAVRVALWCAAAVALPLVLNWLIPTVWYSPRLEARVVGPDGAPLANTLVVANWNIVGPWNGASLGQLVLAEVSTGPDGRFSIPAWGPRLTLRGSVYGVDPTLRIIKPGYQPRVIYNREGMGRHDSAAMVIRFRLEQQDIALLPAGGAGDEAALDELRNNIFVLRGLAAPRLRTALDCLIRRQHKIDPGALRWTPPDESAASLAACGEFFKDKEQ
jgi:hypothetical protein